MEPSWESISLDSLSLLIALAGLGIAAWALWTGQTKHQGIDGLFLILIGLLMAGVFGSMLRKELRRESWRQVFKSLKRHRDRGS